MKFLAGALLLCSLLAACSGAPKDDDLKAALSDQVTALSSNPLTAPLAGQMKEALGKIHIVGCTKADAGGYQCDIAGAGGNAKSIRMVEDGSKWKIVD